MVTKAFYCLYAYLDFCCVYAYVCMLYICVRVYIYFLLYVYMCIYTQRDTSPSQPLCHMRLWAYGKELGERDPSETFVTVRHNPIGLRCRSLAGLLRPSSQRGCSAENERRRAALTQEPFKAGCLATEFPTAPCLFCLSKPVQQLLMCGRTSAQGYLFNFCYILVACLGTTMLYYRCQHQHCQIPIFKLRDPWMPFPRGAG